MLWIHGPQPLMLDEHEPLKQRLFWRSGETAPLLMELQTVPGPNRVLEKLGEFARLRSIPRFGTVNEDLQRQFRLWSGETKALLPVRERLEDSSASENERGIKSTKHLARLWAFSEVLKLHAAGKLPDAIKLAATYQLVTPVSGAVVLETKEQFQRAGLEAVDPQSVPSVPEPGVILLLASGLALLFVMHGRKRARAAQP